jgi:hypothetical protein
LKEGLWELGSGHWSEEAEAASRKHSATAK